MKVFQFITTVLGVLAITIGYAFAGLPDGTRLTIEAGSFFDFDVSSPFPPVVPLVEGADGLVLGIPVPASAGSFHPGPLNGNPGEAGGIVQSFEIFFNTATFWTEGTAIHDNGDGTVDMSGLRGAWSDFAPSISFDPPLAQLSTDGSTYALDYTGVVGPPFTGVPFSLHLEGFVDAGGPAIGVSIVLDGDMTRECSEPGGAPVMATADVTLVGGAVLGSISWTVDGADAGIGPAIQPFLTLVTTRSL